MRAAFASRNADCEPAVILNRATAESLMERAGIGYAAQIQGVETFLPSSRHERKLWTVIQITF
jgi:hypothetical protein